MFSFWVIFTHFDQLHNGPFTENPELLAKNALTESDLRDILNIHGDHCHGAIRLTEVEITT